MSPMICGDQVSTAEIGLDRALGALYGLAIGDALGMPAQELDRDSARRILGTPPDFRDGPPENAISRGLPAGSITDDTMQCLVIARLLISGRGNIQPRELAVALIAWERSMKERGRFELLGPSTRRALAEVSAGADPALTGRTGTTNGAAMRITPVGIANPMSPLERLLGAVMAADRVTHDTPIAHAGAAVVAAVVSAGVEGETFVEAARLGIRAAGHFGFAGLFEAALALDSVDALVARFGSGVETVESVPTAFGLAALSRGDTWLACTSAAALGGDTDTIAALAGAMVGACTGYRAVPAGPVRTVKSVNELDLEPLARGLLELRSR
jgi:ADP-ribosylglycohydrolase